MIAIIIVLLILAIIILREINKKQISKNKSQNPIDLGWDEYKLKLWNGETWKEVKCPCAWQSSYICKNCNNKKQEEV